MVETPTASPPFSELHHISIVVRDVDSSQRFYESIGIGPFVEYPPMREYVDIRVPDEKGFYSLKVRCAKIGPVQLQLVQPGEGRSIYKDFLEKRGEGVFHLGFVVDDVDAAQTKVEDMGLDVLSRGRRRDGTGFTYFDTMDQAGVTLLVRQSPPSG